jgi:glutaconyl-CoA decarboxylase
MGEGEVFFMKKYNVIVNGHTYEVFVEDAGTVAQPSFAPAAVPVPISAPAPIAAPAPVAAAAEPEPAPVAAPAADAEVVRSPMPGTIVSVAVKPGDRVKYGDLLFVLEAMKMENEIYAPHDATVTGVLVNAGANVNTNDSIIALG